MTDDASVLYTDRRRADESGVRFLVQPLEDVNTVLLLYGTFSDDAASPRIIGTYRAGISFSDVSEDSWYCADVYTAAELGLLSGMGGGVFDPDGTLTWAQAIKLAACINQYEQTGEVTLENGAETWYVPYMDYCLEAGILTEAPAQPNGTITRAEFAALFAASLSEETLSEINYVAYGAIPDVPVTLPGAEAIYTLYRAGVLQGSGETRSFLPDTAIRRCEAAAILIRMTDREARLPFTLA